MVDYASKVDYALNSYRRQKTAVPLSYFIIFAVLEIVLDLVF